AQLCRILRGVGCLREQQGDEKGGRILLLRPLCASLLEDAHILGGQGHDTPIAPSMELVSGLHVQAAWNGRPVAREKPRLEEAAILEEAATFLEEAAIFEEDAIFEEAAIHVNNRRTASDGSTRPTDQSDRNIRASGATSCPVMDCLSAGVHGCADGP